MSFAVSEPFADLFARAISMPRPFCDILRCSGAISSNARIRGCSDSGVEMLQKSILRPKQTTIIEWARVGEGIPAPKHLPPPITFSRSDRRARRLATSTCPRRSQSRCGGSRAEARSRPNHVRPVRAPMLPVIGSCPSRTLHRVERIVLALTR